MIFGLGSLVVDDIGDGDFVVLSLSEVRGVVFGVAIVSASGEVDLFPVVVEQGDSGS